MIIKSLINLIYVTIFGYFNAYQTIKNNSNHNNNTQNK
jgi:hypothetical protein